MILLPSRGIAVKPRAVTAHHIELDVFCDWIEACAILENTDVSRADVVDLLLDEELYQSQDFAREIVDDAWLDIERRSELCPSAYGVRVDGEWVRSTGKWSDRIAYTFCLILSLATRYDWWHKKFGSNYLEQGRLFEALTNQALKVLSPEWTTFATGWTGKKAIQALATAQEIADRINSGPITNPGWNTDKAKDLSLDLLMYLPFADGRQGCPYFLVQCKSGGDWDQKLKEPDIDQWRKLLNPDTLPMRGFAVPFSLPDEKFSFAASRSTGLFLDRCRLLSVADKNSTWLPSKIEAQMRAWTGRRIKHLLERSK